MANLGTAPSSLLFYAKAAPRWRLATYVVLLALVGVVFLLVGMHANSPHTVATTSVTSTVNGGVAVQANPTASQNLLSLVSVVAGAVSAIAAVAAVVVAVISRRRPA